MDHEVVEAQGRVQGLLRFRCIWFLDFGRTIANCRIGRILL